MRSTRDLDLAKMEAFRDAHRNQFSKAVLDRVHHQTKSYDIEKIRRLLIEAHKRNDLREVGRLENILWQEQRRLERR